MTLLELYKEKELWRQVTWDLILPCFQFSVALVMWMGLRLSHL